MDWTHHWRQFGRKKGWGPAVREVRSPGKEGMGLTLTGGAGVRSLLAASRGGGESAG